MSLNLIASILLLATSAFGADLPKHPFMKNLKLEPIAASKEISVSAEVVLPDDHKLNRQAPSELSIYEKTKTGWQLLDTVDLKSLFTVGNTITVNKNIALSSTTSDLALDSTLFHCDKKNTHCAIESFQGVAKRSPQKGGHLLVTRILGSRP